MLTPKYEFIDHSKLEPDRLVGIFHKSHAPWMNTLVQKKFYWSLLGAFAPNKQQLRRYLNSNTALELDEQGLTAWLTNDSLLKVQIFKKAMDEWKNVSPTPYLAREAIERWYSDNFKINVRDRL